MGIGQAWTQKTKFFKPQKKDFNGSPAFNTHENMPAPRSRREDELVLAET